MLQFTAELSSHTIRTIILVGFCAISLGGCADRPGAAVNHFNDLVDDVPRKFLADSKFEIPEISSERIRRAAVFAQPISVVLINGIHVKPPFRLIQTDYQFVLEGTDSRVVLWEYPREPEMTGSPKLPPPWPAAFSEAATFQELDNDDVLFRHLNGVHSYFAHRFRTPEVATHITDYVRSLSFVESAKWSGDDNDPLRVNQFLLLRSKSGEERRWFDYRWNLEKANPVNQRSTLGFPNLDWLIPDSPESLAMIRGRDLDPRWPYFHGLLERGALAMNNGSNGSNFDWATINDGDLEQMEQILLQKKSRDDRALAIKTHFNLIHSGKIQWWPKVLNLVDHFDASQEMRDWFASQSARSRSQPG